MNHEQILRIARAFNVSIDFLLRESNIPDRKNYDISELRLSAQADLTNIQNQFMAVLKEVKVAGSDFIRAEKPDSLNQALVNIFQINPEDNHHASDK